MQRGPSGRNSSTWPVTYYVLFFIHLESRRISLAGITRHPDQAWMQQMARNATGEAWGFLNQLRYALQNSHTERWVRSVKSECLSKLILFGEASLRRALIDFRFCLTDLNHASLTG